MEPTWKHPELGTFEYDIIGWRKIIKAPAFDVFNYESKYGHSDRPNGEYRLIFATESEAKMPSNAAIKLADRILERQNQLPGILVRGLWAELTGTSPDSGMWWYDQLDEVNGLLNLDGEKTPEGPEDLFALLRLSSICIHADGAMAEFRYAAPSFEEEHGVGILTDGERVCGTGYAGEADPYTTL